MDNYIAIHNYKKFRRIDYIFKKVDIPRDCSKCGKENDRQPYRMCSACSGSDQLLPDKCMMCDLEVIHGKFHCKFHDRMIGRFWSPRITVIRREQCVVCSSNPVPSDHIACKSCIPCEWCNSPFPSNHRQCSYYKLHLNTNFDKSKNDREFMSCLDRCDLGCNWTEGFIILLIALRRIRMKVPKPILKIIFELFAIALKS